MSNIIDLSQTLSRNMPVFPGDDLPEFSIDQELLKKNIQVTTMKITTHTGTHLDCPSHLEDKKIYSKGMNLDSFYGKAAVIDVRNHIKNNVINIALEDKYFNYQYLLFYTGHSVYWDDDKYFKEYPYLDNKLVEKISKSSIKGIGIDTGNVDKVYDLDFPNHHLLLKNEKVIVENLTNLNSLIDKEFMFIAFPLKIENGDGSPVRAVALID